MSFDPVSRILSKKINIDLKSKNREKDTDDYAMKYAKREGDKFRCSTCGYECDTRGDLFDHKQRVHGRP